MPHVNAGPWPDPVHDTTRCFSKSRCYSKTSIESAELECLDLAACANDFVEPVESSFGAIDPLDILEPESDIEFDGLGLDEPG